MASEKRSPAQLAHRARENDHHLAGQITRDISQEAAWPQDRLVATAPKNGRSRFEIRLRSFDGLRRVVLGQRDQNGVGGFKDAGPTLVFGPQHIADLQDILDRARRACREEGLLP